MRTERVAVLWVISAAVLGLPSSAARCTEAASPAPDGQPAERTLEEKDFCFDGEYGSQGATVERSGHNHFRILLSHAPKNETWSNMLQFELKVGGRVDLLQLDVDGPPGYSYHDYFCSWSYDKETWTAARWKRTASGGYRLVFNDLNTEVLYLGHQVPISYRKIEQLAATWAKHPHVKVHEIGRSIQDRAICRIEVSDFASEHKEQQKWVHYFANQHTGECNAIWRMVGMIEWLLSDQGRDARRRSICHFVLMMSPDGAPNGWHRVNAEGIDMNRSYSPAGSEKCRAHEARLAQSDLERLMKSPAPVTTVWSMHTWSGSRVEPIVLCGPEFGTHVGTFEDLAEAIEKHDTHDRIAPLKRAKNGKDGIKSTWHVGPAVQFDITGFLIEGGGHALTREECQMGGAVLIEGLMDFYKGIKPQAFRQESKNAAP